MPDTETRGEYSEAAKPRPLQEHLNRANAAWEKLAAFVRSNRPSTGPTPLFDAQLEALRLSAGNGYWLYPLVEARRGMPR